MNAIELERAINNAITEENKAHEAQRDALAELHKCGGWTEANRINHFEAEQKSAAAAALTLALLKEWDSLGYTGDEGEAAQ